MAIKAWSSDGQGLTNLRPWYDLKPLSGGGIHGRGYERAATARVLSGPITPPPSWPPSAT